LIPPPPGSIAQITTAPPASDFTGVPLEPVGGRTTVPKVEVLGGEAIVSGIVIGPDGPVGGATVRLERFVGDAVGRLDITSNGDGTWRAPQTPPAIGPPGVLGGRYRIRAWRSPDVALTTPQILFVEAKQNKNLPLQLSRYTGASVSAQISPDPPVLDGVANVTAVVTNLSVDAEGVVRSVPAAGLFVSLSVGSGFEQLGSVQGTTNGQGRASFQIRCLALGASQVEVTVNQLQTYTLPVRPCAAPAPTTTTSTTLFPDEFGTSTSTSAPLASTTTSRPPRP